MSAGAVRFRREETEEAGLGLAPLIDVVFLLLIFFVVTTSFTTPRLPLELPRAEAGEAGGSATLTVTLTADGGLLLDRTPVDLEGLGAAFARAAGPGAELEIRADRAVPHGRVVEVMDRARRHGLREIAVGVEATTP